MIGLLVMVDSATRFMAVRTIPDESSNSLITAVEREWIRYFGPPKQLGVDEWSGWGSDAVMQWSGDHDIEMKIPPGLDGLHTALNWTVPTLNQCTFVNGYTPMQLALGRQPNMPGLISDERTGPIQLQQTEQDRLRRRLELKASAQNACARAEIDVKLRRALLRRFSGADEDLQPGERCLYWREVGNRFHTVQWKGPATVVAVQHDPDTGTIDTYWLAHGTVLIRAGRQHVRRLVGQDGLVNGTQKAEQAIAGLRQRRVVRTADLRRINKHTLEELEGEISDAPSPKKAKTDPLPAQGEPDAPADRPESLSYEPTEPIDDLPKDPAEDLPVADPSSGLDLPTDPGLDLPDESKRMDLDLRDSTEPQTSQDATAAPSTEGTGPGLAPDPLPQDIPIPDDDDESDQPTLAADNTVTQPPLHDDQSQNPNLPGLSFAERRRRQERQETSWLRSPLWPLIHEAPDPESPGHSKRARHHESVNIAVELYPNGCEGSTPLPAGWHYDPKTHEIYLGATADFWSFEDGFLVRNHVWSRDCTYHTSDFPLPSSKLQTTSGLTMRRNSRVILVNDEQSAPVGDQPWFGKTLYPLTKKAAEEFGQNYVGNLTKKFANKTIRSRGHIWSAQASPKKKNVKDSADLKESRMSLEDRLAFIEGKKAELASIFENQAWEIELHPEKVDWNRVMKARFVLKWAVDSNGNPRAKARLVLQGFSDPDLLRGELDTSSPTLSRSSRQILLAIATCKSWLLFISDVATAFLQGDPQKRILWARIPKDACQLIGVPAGTLMRLLKPIYGQADAPRRWFQVARRRLISAGYQPHPLDQCLYCLFHDGQLVSMIGIHVDDLIGGGLETDEIYQKAKAALHESFNFKRWSEAKPGTHLEFCGCRLDSIDGGGWLLHQQEYMQKIKPMTLTDQDEDRQLTPKEVSMLRALLGALQWPSTQTSPHLSASVSLLCGEVSGATVATATQANKLLRFSKSNSDVGLQFSILGELHELCMIALSDAAWGVRKNHESQGGYFVLLMNKRALAGHMDEPYVVLDWRSYKLSRISRSSLNAEAQACAGAMDALEYLLIFWYGCVTPDFELRLLDVNDISMPSALVVDAKALYDSLKAEVPQMQGDRRSKIEVMVVKQKMDEMKTKLKWISSETQLADGATKSAARQLLADRLRSHVFSLQSDQTFQAAKRKTVAERQASARRNAIGRLVNKHTLGFAVLTNQFEPARGDDFSADEFSFFNYIFFYTFLVMFAATMFLAGQCLYRMSRSLPRPSFAQFFQRMPWSLPRPSIAFLWKSKAVLIDATTQTDDSEPLRTPNDVSLQTRDDQSIRMMNCRIQMLQQQAAEKDDRIQDLEGLVHYYETDISDASLFVSRTGERYHLKRSCRALSCANQAGIRRLTCCSQCIQQLRDESNLGGPW
eukprot:s1444_g8.t1